MKHLLGSFIVVVLLTACGGEDRDRADDSATRTPTDASEPKVVEIVSGSAAGGEVVAEATVIASNRDLTRFLTQFDSPSFAGDLTEAVDAVALEPDRVVGLAVIAIGCDVPPGATVTAEDGAYVVMPAKVVSPHIECLVPVTSVAVLDLPAD